ncbi:MAG: hypothetical protein C4525_01850 [Desulfarculus sp.]|jgi:hypothetical protein|nr:MAG: hypothetical protein C4525_01850 [Desulfarculus sp.]
MPKKPTEAYGYIAFSKSGKVEKHMDLLSSDKPIQEQQVAEIFIAAYNQAFPETAFDECRPLPENDQDFVLLGPGREIDLQITELVSRAYTFEMTREEYDRCDWKVATQKEYGGIPWRIDTDKRDAALFAQITKKQAKRYARTAGRDLWLLVFTTDGLYETEYYSAGSLRTSAALNFTRDNLKKQTSVGFENIWFTNLQTRPVLVWPAA